MRPSMMELMDQASINAVEDKLKMGLDRDAAAMMVAASDDRGPAGAQDAEFMAEVRRIVADEVSVGEDVPREMYSDEQRSAFERI